MKVNIYLKGGQTISLNHVANIRTERSNSTNELVGYSIEREDAMPTSAETLHTLEMDQVAAITVVRDA